MLNVSQQELLVLWGVNDFRLRSNLPLPLPRGQHHMRRHQAGEDFFQKIIVLYDGGGCVADQEPWQ